MDPRPARTWSVPELAAVLDHTLLAAAATATDALRLCEEAREHGFAAVCVNGVHVRRCAEVLHGSRVKVCSVVGFPLGASAPDVKRHEARLALEHGARELDMVIQIGALRAGEHALVARDIGGVVAAARTADALVKVILETGLLDPAECARGCRLAEEAGADFVKTGTGFGPRGATVADVALLRASVGPHTGVKAAGGVRTLGQALALLAAGATRIGSSSAVALVRAVESEES